MKYDVKICRLDFELTPPFSKVG